MITATQQIAIAEPWQLEFPESQGAPAKAAFEELKSWTDADEQGIRDFSGIATYRTTFICPAALAAPGAQITLDLGRVAEVCEVWLNGRQLGIGWKDQFSYSFTPCAIPLQSVRAIFRGFRERAGRRRPASKPRSRRRSRT